MAESDAEFLQQYWEYLNWDTEDADFDRLFALARRGATAAAEIEYLKEGKKLVIWKYRETARRVMELEAALRAARVSVEGWGSYASDYHKEKWDLAGDLTFIDAALAKTGET
jgi:hypothetical protein